MKDGLKVLVGRGLPDSLSKRERQVMADAKAFAKAADAFSVSFFATRRTTKAIVYLKQPEPKRLQQADLDLEEDDCEKDGDAGDAPAPAPASAGAKRGAQPPTKPPGSTSKHISNMAEGISTPSRPPGKLTHAKEATKARGVDKNALSARGSPEGERLSPAAPDDDPMGERDEGTSSKTEAEGCLQVVAGTNAACTEWAPAASPAEKAGQVVLCLRGLPSIWRPEEEGLDPQIRWQNLGGGWRRPRGSW